MLGPIPLSSVVPPAPPQPLNTQWLQGSWICPVNGTVAMHPDIQPMWDEMKHRLGLGPAPHTYPPCVFLDGPDAPFEDEYEHHDVDLPPQPSDGLQFVAAKQFTGARPGFFFGTGKKGLGYDPLVTPRAAPEGSLPNACGLGTMQLALEQ